MEGYRLPLELDRANPAPLGLVGFGLTTVLLSLVNAGIIQGEPVVLPLAIAFGGSMQIVAGILEYGKGNTFGTTAFASYGAFWWWFALLNLFAGNGWVDPSSFGSAVSVALLLWGVFTFYMWIATFKLNWALWSVFLTLWVTFILLGLGMDTLGGYVGILTGALAMYTSFAEVANFTWGREVIPVGGQPLADDSSSV